MRLIWILSLFLGACAAGPERGSRPSASAFPNSWLGTWEGPVEIVAGDGLRPGFTMRLEVAPTDDPRRFSWTTTYTDKTGPHVRPYELVLRDIGRGEVAIDEGNGVVLEARYLANTLYTWFEIGGALLSVREELRARGTSSEALLFELLSAPSTGTSSGPSDARAMSFTPTVLQRAVLRRVRGTPPP